MTESICTPILVYYSEKSQQAEVTRHNSAPPSTLEQSTERGVALYSAACGGQGGGPLLSDNSHSKATLPDTGRKMAKAAKNCFHWGNRKRLKTF